MKTEKSILKRTKWSLENSEEGDDLKMKNLASMSSDPIVIVVDEEEEVEEEESAAALFLSSLTSR